MKTSIIKTITKIIPLVALASLVPFFAGGCASMLSHTGSDTKRSTSAVEFLYPNKQPFVQPSIPTLSLPMRVGIVFVPAQTASGKGAPRPSEHLRASMSEASKNALMRSVSDQFKKLPYVNAIEVIPTQYLRPGGSFDNLDQLRSLLGIDVIVLLAYDQQQNTTDSWLTLSYWTIVGAYTVKAQKNTTTTLMEAVVYDIASRKLLFRAAGTDETNARSTFVGTSDHLAQDSGASFKKAAADLGKNLQTQLADFKERIKESPEEVKLVAKPGYNLAAGALGAREAAAMAALSMLMLAGSTRRGRNFGGKVLAMLKLHSSRLVVAMILSGALMFSSGCISAVVLSAGKTERRVFRENPSPATRGHIEKKIGAPKETHQLDTIPQLSDFRALSARYQKELVSENRGPLQLDGRLPIVRVYLTRDNACGYAGFYDPGMSNNKPLGGDSVLGPITYARYIYKGRIVPGSLQGAYIATSIGSWGIAEPFLIPLALLTRVTRNTNYIDVWYDATGYVLAYSWSIKPHESVAF